RGMPRLRAKRFIVPAGRIASAFLLPIILPAAVETVPSPPPTMTTSQSSARAVSISFSSPSPAMVNMSTSCPAFSRTWRRSALNLSRSRLRSAPPCSLRMTRIFICPPTPSASIRSGGLAAPRRKYRRNRMKQSALSSCEGRALSLPPRKVWQGRGRAKEHAQGESIMIRNLLATTAIATLVASGAYAQTAPAPVAPMEQPDVQMKHADGHLASDIIGQTVYSGPGDDAQNIGKVSDLVITPEGDIEAIVVGV